MTARYLLTNWKSTKTLGEAEAWLEKYCEIRPDSALRVIVAPPMPYLVPMRRILQRLETAGPALAVQDLSRMALV